MKSSFLLFLLFVSMTCFGQNEQVTGYVLIQGTVTDPDDLPLLGATVQVKNTEKFVTSDFDGNYTIYAKPADTLVFSYPGYKTEEKIIGARRVVNVTLEIIPELVEISFKHPKIHTAILIENSFNYDIKNLSLYFTGHSLPFSFGGQIGSDFEANSRLKYYLWKSFRVLKDRYLGLELSVENLNFNVKQFHQYLITASTSFDLLKFNSKNYRYPQLNLIVGHLNYDGREQNESLGIGLGLSRDLFSNFNLSASYTYWGDINELKTEILYKFGYSKWSALANYRHLSSYEEFQIGIAYRLDFY